MVGKKGKTQLLVQYLTALYGNMVALLLYYKKIVKSLKSNEFRLNPHCPSNKQVKVGAIECVHSRQQLQDITSCSPKVVDKTIVWL